MNCSKDNECEYVGCGLNPDKSHTFDTTTLCYNNKCAKRDDSGKIDYCPSVQAVSSGSEYKRDRRDKFFEIYSYGYWNSFNIMIFILIGFWILTGIAAFIMSLTCFGYNNDGGYAILGLILAVLTGPFYWLYYAFNRKYCYKSII